MLPIDASLETRIDSPVPAKFVATKGTIHERVQSRIQWVPLVEKNARRCLAKMGDVCVVLVVLWATIHGHVQCYILNEKSSGSEELIALGFVQPVEKAVIIFELALRSIQMQQRKGCEGW